MKIYLVGGAVRDKLLNISTADKDFVVVGATQKQMLELGYHQVGKNFPVFLHPKTKEEFALARKEKKHGSGYTGFNCFSDANVTLNEDLFRRDLTINAIAEDKQGKLYDPYNGKKDIEHKILRHISPAFVEDPLRVLRVARFASKLHTLQFTIAPETLSLMEEISLSGELSTLPVERVWLEFEKALATDSPQIFIQVLYQCQALKLLIPELNSLYETDIKLNSNTSINLGKFTENSLKKITLLTCDKSLRFASIAVSFTLNFLHQTDQTSLASKLNSFYKSLRLPNEYLELANVASVIFPKLIKIQTLSSQDLLFIFDKTHAWKSVTLLEKVLLLTKTTDAEKSFTSAQEKHLLNCFNAAKKIEIEPILQAGFKGKDIKVELQKRRINAIETYINGSEH